MDWKKIGVQFVATFIAGIIIFPLLDFLLATFITHGPFDLNVVAYLVDALLFAVIFSIIDVIFERLRKR